jgi:hypothetical protein
VFDALHDGVYGALQERDVHVEAVDELCGLVEGQVVNQVEGPEHQIHWGRVALDRMLAIH